MLWGWQSRLICHGENLGWSIALFFLIQPLQVQGTAECELKIVQHKEWMVNKQSNHHIQGTFQRYIISESCQQINSIFLSQHAVLIDSQLKLIMLNIAGIGTGNDENIWTERENVSGK